jgi:hypothetical protein
VSAGSSAPDGPTQADRNKRILLGVAAAVVVALIVVLFVVLQGRDDDDNKPPSSSATTPSSSGAPSSRPSKVPTTHGPTPSATPAPSKAPPKTVPASFSDNVPLNDGVSVEVADIESVKGEAHGPGQVAGPALRFTIQVTNKSKKALDLDLAIVNAYSGRKDDPAVQLDGPGGSPLPQKLKAGGVASGKYVFNIPVKDRGHVRVDFSYTIDQPTVIFRGPGR